MIQKKLQVNIDCFTEFLSGFTGPLGERYFEVTGYALPPNHKIVRVGAAHDHILFTLESPDFIDDGHEILIAPTLRIIHQ